LRENSWKVDEHFSQFFFGENLPEVSRTTVTTVMYILTMLKKSLSLSSNTSIFNTEAAFKPQTSSAVLVTDDD